MVFRSSKVDDVRRQQLCSGCGACAFVSPELYSIENVEREGLRPVRSAIATGDQREAEERAFQACPGIQLEHSTDQDSAQFVTELRAGWGPVIDLWEGAATDEELRFRGSSGGAISALALFGLEQQPITGVLHTAADLQNPILNQTVYSRTRAELLRGSGSRYAPASPCAGLDHIVNAPGSSIFIGKPCDVAAVQKTRQIEPVLNEKVALTIALFCAGTPSTAGTRELLKSMGLTSEDEVQDFRYRGHGWPGKATAVTADGQQRTLTYQQSWGEILTKHVQWRCRLCADHTGEFADIAVGDPWYREPQEGEAGASLIVARTEVGRKFVDAAIAAGYLDAERVAPEILPASQPNLLHTRGAVWGRNLACRLIGAGAPRYRGLPTFRFWVNELSLLEKVRTIVGTVRRVVTRRYLPKLLSFREDHDQPSETGARSVKQTPPTPETPVSATTKNF